MSTIVLAIGVAMISASFTRWLSRANGWFYLLDHPVDRSLHERPTPRLGGLAIMASLYLGVAIGTEARRLGGQPLPWRARRTEIAFDGPKGRHRGGLHQRVRWRRVA